MRYGEIQSTNAGGVSGKVLLTGCTYPINNVPFTSKGSSGMCVPVGYIRGDRQVPIAITKRGGRQWQYNTSTPISSLNWHSWRSALYRGAWNNTNILPNLSNAETILYTQPNPEGTAPTFGSSKVHDGYVYGTEYYASQDNRLIRISLTDGLKTYATWNGNSMYRHPDDLILAEEGGVLYAYIIYPWGYDFYIAKYNLDTMARVYLVSEVLFNTNRYNYRRLFEDSSYIYVFFYDGTFERYEYIRKYNKATGTDFTF